MVYILHGHPISICTQRVLVAVIELGLYNDKDFKFDVVEDESIIKTPAWLAHQPFGQIPWLEDTETGVEISESRAIVNYLARKTGSSLIPPPGDFARMAAFDSAVSAESANFNPSASSIAAQLVFGPMHGRRVDRKVLNASITMLSAKLKGYEVILSKQRYFAGNELSVVDLYHLPYGAAITEVGRALELTDGSLPNVTRWWKEISSLPSWIQASVLVAED